MNINPRQVGARLHTLMHSMFVKVPSENMGKMCLLKLEDLPLLIAVGPTMVGKTTASLRTFQCNLKDYEWPSLAEIYPRPMLWFYAYMLFFWGRYCNALSLILNHPDRSLPAEIYLRLICQIDTYLDSFDSRSLRDHLVQRIETQSIIQTVRSDLDRRLGALCEGTWNRDHLLGLVNTYLDHNLVAFQRWMTSEKMTLGEIKMFKETTTGELYATWSQILSGLYHIPDELTENAARIIFLYGMAMQVVDDIADAGQDYQVNSPNILLGIARDNPDEYKRLISRLEEIKYKYLHWPWVKRNTPQSYARAIDWIYSYVGEIKAVTRHRPLTNELINSIAILIAIAGYENIKF